ncbi:MAG: sensor histidine kinase, partial [Methanobacteriaceae archaeon]|nr:sensor histidine kinase [Methanobacteriaceae archaeon]
KIFENVTPENSSMKSLTTIITPTGKEKVLEYYCKAKFNEKRELTKFVSFVHDITEMVEREKELEQLSEDRKILLQEVHHRVKNNLQLILSFLNLESRFNKNDPEYVLEQTQNRIRTMALTHEEVYQSNSVSNINLEHFLTTGMNNLFNLYTEGKIKLNFNIESIELDMEKSIPLGLLVNEVALNTIKYAFPDKNEGNFYIDLKSTDDMIDLKIWDDGVGLPENVNLYNSDSLGFIIINNLTQQLEAELTVLDDVSGFGINLKFKT